MDDALISKFGRRIRLGMVGGGLGSVIGETHMIAFRADGFYDLVAGALSSRSAVALASAARHMIAPDRRYQGYAEMADAEAQRSDRIDAVVIATPPDSHFDIARLFLEKGIDVICEKPMTANLEQAKRLAALVSSSGRFFMLTHCYSGYPMVREARARISNGFIGPVRMIEIEFCPGGPGMANQTSDPEARHWRMSSKANGKAGILAEVNSHSYHMATYLTGLAAEAVAARLHTFAAGREVYDNAYLTLEYGSGVQGRLWCSYAASGNDMGFKLRIFGETGHLAWDQENPEVLVHKAVGGPATFLSRGYDDLSQDSLAVSRFRPGFPEGYALAFANIYADFARAFIARALGRDSASYMERLPDVSVGVEGLAMIEAATRSHDAGGTWQRLDDLRKL